MKSVSWLVLGVIHLPKNYVLYTLKDCLKLIAKNQITKKRGKFEYTICNMEERDSIIYGELVRISLETKERYFDTRTWRLKYHDLQGRRTAVGSRFVLIDETMVIEERTTHLPKTTFRNMLEELIRDVLKDQMFTLSIYFYKDERLIKAWIDDQDLLTTLAASNIKLKNIYHKRDKIQAALDLIEENKSTKVKIENENGLNKDGGLVGGLIGLAEQGQLDLALSGAKNELPPEGQQIPFQETSKFFTRKKTNTLMEKIEIDDEDVGTFINISIRFHHRIIKK